MPTVRGKQAKDLAKKLGLKSKREPKVKPPLRGEPQMQMWLSLPWPPAVNNLYATVNGHRVLSKAGREYKKAVAERCRQGHCIGRLKVDAWAHMPDNRKRDLDGLWKAILDALTDAGVWEDDSQIDHLSIHRAETVEDRENAYIAVEIRGEYPS